MESTETSHTYGKKKIKPLETNLHSSRSNLNTSLNLETDLVNHFTGNQDLNLSLKQIPTHWLHNSEGKLLQRQAQKHFKEANLFAVLKQH